MKTHSLRLVTLAVCCATFAGAQSTPPPTDDTRLKQVIIFGRHGVRSSVVPAAVLNTFAALPYPPFTAAPPPASVPLPTEGFLTVNGAAMETTLGGYYRLWLTSEGLLTGHDAADASFFYFHANNIERTILTAQSLWTGMLPGGGPPNVSAAPQGSRDPLFDPVGAGVAQIDVQKAAAAVNGRLGGNPQALASAYASEYALIRSVLFDYPADTLTPPPAPAGKVDVTAIPIQVAAGTPASPVSFGGLAYVNYAVDGFVMEYADGFAPSDVGWGLLNAAGVSQTLRILNLVQDLNVRTPYVDGVLSSNVASHLVRSLVQAATGNAIPGSLGTPSTKVIGLIASDNNILGLAGLFHLDWIVPGYQQDFAAPGGALVFELRQSQRTGEYLVRTSYVVQTLDQLRNRTILTLSSPPARAPVFIPGCSVGNATFDCPLAAFVKLASRVIDPLSADRTNE